MSSNYISLQRIVFQKILPNLVEKMKQDYVFPKLTDYIYVRSFDLWISKGAHDVFALVINFMIYDW
jgi:hypothetical protein